jgi:hypothetical protein
VDPMEWIWNEYGARGCKFLRLMSNKITSRLNGYFPRFTFQFFSKKNFYDHGKIVEFCYLDWKWDLDLLCNSLCILWTRLFLKTYTNLKLHAILKWHKCASKLVITYKMTLRYLLLNIHINNQSTLYKMNGVSKRWHSVCSRRAVQAWNAKIFPLRSCRVHDRRLNCYIIAAF